MTNDNILGSLKHFYATSEFSRTWQLPISESRRLQLIADMCRLNTITAIKRAGSGHLGSSLSSMDIFVWLYFKILKGDLADFVNPNSDTFFSSKGHDVPGQYSVLAARGLLPTEKLLKLRRLGGLDGHPDVRIPGIVANTGSLGMGISKACGIAWSKMSKQGKGHAFVLVGDGEFQEGQNYEALQWAAHAHQGNIVVIMDHNKLQTDKWVSEIVDLGELQAKLSSFGWAVERCNGHDFENMTLSVNRLLSRGNRPKFLIADTIKGAGVKFMEHPEVMRDAQIVYRWHSGAPDDQSYLGAIKELTERVTSTWPTNEGGPLPSRMELIDVESRPNVQGNSAPTMKASNEFVVDGFEKALLEISAKNPNITVLDGDLASDCRIREFEKRAPRQFIECGIAEQHMVSMAGALARQGKIPIVNSFSSFLVSRANEQIYNNACERSQIIYACHFSGFIPAGPGKSHQSVRDISLLSAVPKMTMVQPASAAEAQVLLKYLIEKENGPCALRMNIGPSPRIINTPDNYEVLKGRGHTLVEGHSIALMSYGPVMLHETLIAAEIIQESGLSAPRVINMPWLSHVDTEWLIMALKGINTLYVIEDHCVRGGLGDRIGRVISENPETIKCLLNVFGIEESPECGTPQEVLKHHGLDGKSMAERILVAIGKNRIGQREMLAANTREAFDDQSAPQ